MAVAVGGTEVAVGGMDVTVGSAAPQATPRIKTIVSVAISLRPLECAGKTGKE